VVPVQAKVSRPVTAMPSSTTRVSSNSSGINDSYDTGERYRSLHSTVFGESSKVYGALVIDSEVKDSKKATQVSLLPLLLLIVHSPRLAVHFWRPPCDPEPLSRILDLQNNAKWKAFVLSYVSSMTITFEAVDSISILAVQVRDRAQGHRVPEPSRWETHKAWKMSVGLDVVGLPTSWILVTVEPLGYDGSRRMILAD
jgi:hypothetical protein